MTNTVRTLVLLLTLPLLFTGCARSFRLGWGSDNASLPLYIAMPENNLVFENLSPLAYQAFWDHFQQRGYQMRTSPHNAYELRTKITNRNDEAKLLSLDILTYGYRIRLDLEVELRAASGELLGDEVLISFEWVLPPADPVLNRRYLYEHYKRLFIRIAPRIEHLIRRWVAERSAHEV